jgi:hypothetical protein
VKALLIFAVLAGSLNAASRPNSTSYFEIGLDGVIAQFVDGGDWQTIVTLVNLDNVPGTFTLQLYKDDGTPMTVPTNLGTASGFTATLPVSGSLTIQTAGAGSLQQGWAYLQMSDSVKIGGQAIFRQNVPGRPSFEASLPITTYVNSNSYVIPFDQTTSTTGVAIANPLSYTPIDVYATVYDQQGSQILLDSFTIGPLQHVAFSLSDKYPQMAGRIGTVKFETTGIAMGLLGLRFEAESFTSVLPLVKSP